MAAMFKMKKTDGADSWFVFSDVEGKIVDLGENEDEAKIQAETHTKKVVIQPVSERIVRTEGNIEPAGNAPRDIGNSTGGEAPKPGRRAAGASSVKPIASIPKNPVMEPGQGPGGTPSSGLTPLAVPAPKYKLPPKLLQKLRETFAKVAAEGSITIEEMIFRVFGYTIDDVDETDCDFELLKMAWDAQCESWFETKEIPPWFMIVFAQFSLTIKMVASAKSIAKQKDQKLLHVLPAKEEETDAGKPE